MIERVLFLDFIVYLARLFTRRMFFDIGIMMIKFLSDHRRLRIRFITKTDKLVGRHGTPGAGKIFQQLPVTFGVGATV